MTTYETEILFACLSAVESFGAGDMHAQEAGELIAIGVPYRPAVWRGHPLANKESRRFCVTAQRMEDAGLIRRIASLDRRTTNICPSAAGIEQAFALAVAQGASVDRAAVEKGAAALPWLGKLKRQRRRRDSLVA